MSNTIENKKKLREYLFGFISDNKRNLFEKNILNRTRHLTVVLENIYQPHNASAVLRSCDIFGIQDVHIIENSNKYKLSEQVAMGSSKWLNMYKYNTAEDNTIDCFNKLRAKGYKIVATTPHEKDVMLDEMPLEQKTALVFGTELNGLSDVALENADAYVKIPMYGFTESFNISVSAALSMFHLSEKIRKSDIDWQLSEEEIVDIHINWAKGVIKKSDLIVEDYIMQIEK
ncbi:MAG: TrmH family RNA methyltransferase [Bacteroidetes bacterium]|nr:MAG: TrmH family RNA methyltransferase [Bacteroidota bacterium]